MSKRPPESSEPSQDAASQPGFEEALEELETLIEKIESGQVGLEACLDHYERGMKLIARCQQVLGQAKQRIARLQVTPEGRLETTGDVDPQDADAPSDA